MSAANVSFLRRVLAADAVASGAMGILLALCAGMLGELLALPADLLQQAGSILVPYAAAVGLLASRSQPARWAVWIVIVANVLWVFDSIALLFTGWVQPNALSVTFVVAQAVVVAVLAELEVVGLRRVRAGT